MLATARRWVYDLGWKVPRARVPLLRRALARDPGYSFTADYTGEALPNWEELLAGFRGAAGVRMLEIGSYEGRSAIWFLEHVLTDPTARLTCVDGWFWAEDEMRFDHNLRVSGHAQKVTKLKGRSAEVLPRLPEESFDVVYVDGSHTAPDVMLDAVLAWQRLKPGGILIFDDYLWEPEKPPHERPEMAVDLFLALLEGRYELLLKGYQVAVRRLKA